MSEATVEDLERLLQDLWFENSRNLTEWRAAKFHQFIGWATEEEKEAITKIIDGIYYRVVRKIYNSPIMKALIDLEHIESLPLEEAKAEILACDHTYRVEEFGANYTCEYNLDRVRLILDPEGKIDRVLLG